MSIVDRKHFCVDVCKNRIRFIFIECNSWVQKLFSHSSLVIIYNFMYFFLLEWLCTVNCLPEGRKSRTGHLFTIGYLHSTVALRCFLFACVEFSWIRNRLLLFITIVIDNSRTGLDTSKNQCSAPAVTALKNYWRYHVYNLFRLKNSSNVFAFIIIIIGCLTGNITHDQLKLRPYFLPWVSKNRRYVSTIQSLFLMVLT